MTAHGAGEKIVQVIYFLLQVSLIDLYLFSYLECLKLTKAIQKTCETLQTVANLHDGHVCTLFLAHISIPIFHALGSKDTASNA